MKGLTMLRKMILPLVLFVLALPLLSEAVSRNLAPREAAAMLGQNKDMFLLDVRTFEEYRQLRLDGARLVPIDQLTRRMAEIPRSRPILVYCAVGSRSSQVAGYLVRQGYDEVYNLSGGIYTWAQQGLPILQGGP